MLTSSRDKSPTLQSPVGTDESVGSWHTKTRPAGRKMEVFFVYDATCNEMGRILPRSFSRVFWTVTCQDWVTLRGIVVMHSQWESMYGTISRSHEKYWRVDPSFVLICIKLAIAVTHIWVNSISKDRKMYNLAKNNIWKQACFIYRDPGGTKGAKTSVEH